MYYSCVYTKHLLKRESKMENKFLVLRACNFDSLRVNYVISEETKEYLLTRKAPVFWLYCDKTSLRYYTGSSAEEMFKKIEINRADGNTFDFDFNIKRLMKKGHVELMAKGDISSMITHVEDNTNIINSLFAANNSQVHYDVMTISKSINNIYTITDVKDMLQSVRSCKHHRPDRAIIVNGVLISKGKLDDFQIAVGIQKSFDSYTSDPINKTSGTREFNFETAMRLKESLVA